LGKSREEKGKATQKKVANGSKKGRKKERTRLPTTTFIWCENSKREGKKKKEERRRAKRGGGGDKWRRQMMMSEVVVGAGP